MLLSAYMAVAGRAVEGCANSGAIAGDDCHDEAAEQAHTQPNSERTEPKLMCFEAPTGTCGIVRHLDCRRHTAVVATLMKDEAGNRDVAPSTTRAGASLHGTADPGGRDDRTAIASGRGHLGHSCSQDTRYRTRTVQILKCP